jgi:hypothetical protein
MATYVHSGYLQSAAAATGNGDSLDVRGMSAAGVQLTITNTATVTFEGSLDGSTWVAIPFTNRATGVESSTASASGLFVAGVAGVGFIRARVSAWTSGTVTALAQASTGGDPDQSADAQAVEQYAYSTIASGELQGSASALQMPSIACKLVRFKARSDNAGSVYIGVSGVTAPNGTTDATTGFELVAGDDTGWLPATNLNLFYRISTNAGDDLTYMLMV